MAWLLLSTWLVGYAVGWWARGRERTAAEIADDVAIDINEEFRDARIRR